MVIDGIRVEAVYRHRRSEGDVLVPTGAALINARPAGVRGSPLTYPRGAASGGGIVGEPEQRGAAARPRGLGAAIETRPHDAQDGEGEQDGEGHVRADEGGGEGRRQDGKGRPRRHGPAG